MSLLNASPLANVQAEETVLAAMLNGVVASVAPDDFSTAQFQVIAAAIGALRERGDPIDEVTLAAELLARGQGAEPDLLGSIENLAASAIGLTNVDAHARIVRDCARRREADHVLVQLRDVIASPRGSLGNVLDDAMAILARMADHVRPANVEAPFLSADEMEQLPAPQFLVDGLIPLAGTAELHGPPGCGKSFFALGLACDVASGRPFLGRPVRKGHVVYVAAEGTAGLPVRLRAWKAQREASGVSGVNFYRDAVQLLEPAPVGRFIAHIRALPDAPKLVILDTLARCMVGGEENSAKDMGLAIAAIDRIRRETGAAVLVLHHSRKDGDTERGSTALRGAVDTMMAIKNDGAALRVSCEKQKDAAPFPSFDASLIPAGGSCAIAPKVAWDLSERIPGENHKKLLRALGYFHDQGGATSTNWENASDSPPSTFHRLRSDLVEWGYVTLDKSGKGGRYSITAKGQLLVTPNSHVTPTLQRGSNAGSLPPNSHSLKEWESGGTGLEAA